MTERALLPQFIREALEEGVREGEPAAEASLIASGAAAEASLIASGAAAEASLIASGAAAEASLCTLLSLENTLDGSAIANGAPGADPALLARLEATLSQPPHRYAPFFARAAELFDLPESDVIAQLARLKDPGSWAFAGLPGIAKVKVTGGPRVAEAETLFVRFSPGVRFPEHQHVGLERVLVLEGSYEDSNGVLHRAGELREWPSETAHSFRVGKETCIFASVVFGRRFSSWPLRALARVLGS
jgi:anti-sigma factor ChrR (cupin superfamily)